MSRAEQYSWASLASLGIIFWWFQMRMLDGWTIVDQSAGRLLFVYFAVIAATVALEVVIAIILEAVGGKPPAKDERDLAIDARASLNERLFFIVAINILVWQALWEGALDGHALPKIDLTRLPALFFALFTILFVGEAVKRISTIWLYRAQATHD